MSSPIFSDWTRRARMSDIDALARLLGPRFEIAMKAYPDRPPEFFFVELDDRGLPHPLEVN